MKYIWKNPNFPLLERQALIKGFSENITLIKKTNRLKKRFT